MKFNNKGITLIALVITIIILLILSGITISQLTGSGLFGKARLAKQITRYVSAKEIIDLKLIEIQLDCKQKSEVYNIDKIAKEMEEAEDITIEGFCNKETAKIRDGIENGTTELEGIVVSVNLYSEYKFLIGEEGKIIKVLEGKISDTLVKDDFIDIVEFEKDLFGKETIENINRLEDIYEVGQYVKYSANGYSNWIIAGENENGEIMLVSEGAPEFYTLVGDNREDVLTKLDQYCNQTYVDERYAILSENYSYSNNIGKNGITDAKVLYGTREATSSELLEQYSYGWFLNSYDSNFTYGVYNLENREYGGSSHSYVDKGDRIFIRPVIYLRNGIKYKNGNGTKEEPYELVENS